MKRIFTLSVLLAMIFSLVACGKSGSEESTTSEPPVVAEQTVPAAESEKIEAQMEPATEPSQEELIPEEPEEPQIVGHVISGFDETTNRSVEVGGLRFSIPGYFNVDYELDGYEYACYPDVEEYYATLGFKLEQMGYDELVYFAAKEQLINALEDSWKTAGCTILPREDISIPGLPSSGWIMNYEHEGEHGFHTSMALLFHQGWIVTAEVSYDEKDESNYDYLGDFHKMLETVEVLDSVPAPEETPAATTEKDDYSDSRHQNQARKAFENYGEYMYPYGITYHWFGAHTIRYEGDGVWYLKVDADVKNVTGNERRITVSGRVDFKQEKVTEFNVE